MNDGGSDGAQVDAMFSHEFVNHQVEYVRGNVHCNGVENLWALLQRGLSGTYIPWSRSTAARTSMSRCSGSTSGRTTTAAGS
jgi:hypothetical protein